MFLRCKKCLEDTYVSFSDSAIRRHVRRFLTRRNVRLEWDNVEEGGVTLWPYDATDVGTDNSLYTDYCHPDIREVYYASA
jgi:hypothetical protein